MIQSLHFLIVNRCASSKQYQIGEKISTITQITAATFPQQQHLISQQLTKSIFTFEFKTWLSVKNQTAVKFKGSLKQC